MKLAINGGTPEVKGKLKPFNTIGKQEMRSALSAMDGNHLSGYLAGKARGGKWVRLLENEWQSAFHVKHAIACNSATSGLMAAAFAAGLGFEQDYAVSPMTMSATAAAPKFTGAEPRFVDVNDQDFGMNYIPASVRVAFVTNLFGNVAGLSVADHELLKLNNQIIIEDNAQSPFASVHSKFAGTFGHMGVWSLNVHKPIQCGEGGVVTTDDDNLALALREFINHGENMGSSGGLNLRMPEVSAAIAHTQLRRGPEIIQERMAQADDLLLAMGDIPRLRPPVKRPGVVNVHYTVPFLVEKNRAAFCTALRAEGVPIVEGYVEPLYRMKAFQDYASPCPVAEDLQDRRLFYFENCAWTLTEAQIEQVGNAFQKVAEALL